MKDSIVATIVETLERELAGAAQAALDSAHEATDEESRPENKYDTRGLETSYVAHAQANYAKELKEGLQAYRNLRLSPAEPGSPIALGCLVTTIGPQGRQRFFIGPARGGLEIALPAETITVITPQSPIGRAFMGKRIGAAIEGSGGSTVVRIE